ncbi:MAG: hypothetical protein M3415_05935 [Actinomycetota bacterium]|nr:hypothetical protein [Actinomycetota bacterium]
MAASAVTRPYTATRVVVGVPEDAPPRQDVEGLRVAVEPGAEAAGTLVELGAVPVLTDDVTSIPEDADAAVDEWLLDDWANPASRPPTANLPADRAVAVADRAGAGASRTAVQHRSTQHGIRRRLAGHATGRQP